MNVAKRIEEVLADFDTPVRVVDCMGGPVVETYRLELGPRTRVGKLASLEADLALRLGVDRVRVVPNLPGVALAGVEVPRDDRQIVAPVWSTDESMALPMNLGVDTMGRRIDRDLCDAPHLLVAGTTGSGKSIAIHAMLANFAFCWGSKNLRMVLIDPKMLELSVYRDVPYLLGDVIHNAHDAVKALRILVDEMAARYTELARVGARDIGAYRKSGRHMPYIVVVIDEWADLYLRAKKDIEKPLVQLAQKSRAAGIHIILATQRPSANVISGVIKANFPSRMALRVSSMTDSRVILDSNGAEALEGKGDALISGFGETGLTRVHMPLVYPSEIAQNIHTHRS